MLTDGLFNKEIPSPSTSGNVLTSDGNHWVSQAAAPNVGAWKFLSEVVSTSSSNISFSNVFNSTYDNYRITANNVGGNTSNIAYQAQLEFSNNIGSYTDYNYFARLVPQSTPTFTYGGGTYFTHDQNNTGSDAQRCNFTVDILNPRSTNAKHAIFNGSGYSGFSGIPVNWIFSVLQNYTTTEQTGIRFRPSSGTITGTFRLYGFSKT